MVDQRYAEDWCMLCVGSSHSVPGGVMKSGGESLWDS